MSKKIIITLLCLTLSWIPLSPAYGAPQDGSLTESEIKNRYPDAKVIRVSPEEYPALQEELRREGYRLAGASPTVREDVERGRIPSDCGDNSPEQRSDDDDEESDDDSFDFMVRTVDFVSDISWDKDGAVVLFVIVGAVVVVVWTLYVVKYLVDAAFGREYCGLWSELSMSGSSVSLDSGQHAEFSGVRYLTGFRDGSTDVGISAEFGRANFHLTADVPLERDGVYWLIGPVLRWRLQQDSNPHYFQMEFVAGSTEHEEIGIIASAKAGFNFGVGEGFRWGLNIGAMNIDINEGQGIIREGDEYYYLLGLELGYRL